MSEPVRPLPALSGVRVAVTRPSQQCDAILRLLAARNAYARCLPVVDVVAPVESSAAVAALGAPAAFDIMIFTSVNAVNMALDLLPEGVSLTGGGLAGAVGPATGRALEAAGVKVSICPLEEAGSEGLLQHPALEAGRVVGKRVLLVKGEGGRGLIGEALAGRGAGVTAIDVYRRRCPAGRICDLLGEPLETFQVFVITSGTALGNLLSLANESEKTHVLGAQLVVVSPRLADLVRHHGVLAAPIVSPAPADQAVVDTLVNWWTAHGGGPSVMEVRES